MIRFIKNLARTIGIKNVYGELQYGFLKLRGFQVLSEQKTVAFMQRYEVNVIAEAKVFLPQVNDCIDKEKIVTPAIERTIDSLHVWDYTSVERKARLSKYGSVIIKGKVLCTEWDNSGFYVDMWKKDNRQLIHAPVVIAPFSHRQEELGIKGYFDFIYLVAAKLCRIKDALPDHDFSKTIVSYQPFSGAYENEILELLGFDPANLVDSTTHKVIAPRVITGSKAYWYPHISDVLSFKKHIEKKFKPEKTALKRIYMSRSGRRSIKNEDELIALLQKFDFLIFKDEPRTVTEQISIYYNASFIIGPHGASFANIIWCQPGAHLFELFSPNYSPDFYVYLAKIMGLKYSAYYEGVQDTSVNYFDGLLEDIYVSIPKLETCLTAIFKNEA